MYERASLVQGVYVPRERGRERAGDLRPRLSYAVLPFIKGSLFSHATPGTSFVPNDYHLLIPPIPLLKPANHNEARTSSSCRCRCCHHRLWRDASGRQKLRPRLCAVRSSELESDQGAGRPDPRAFLHPSPCTHPGAAQKDYGRQQQAGQQPLGPGHSGCRVGYPQELHRHIRMRRCPQVHHQADPHGHAYLVDSRLCLSLRRCFEPQEPRCLLDLSPKFPSVYIYNTTLHSLAPYAPEKGSAMMSPAAEWLSPDACALLDAYELSLD
ncbi:hypothetical protein GQ54DRAFT_23415 [Martensiomyces pterosporus]|nr:hypothetical protein GQ54DRAFT_23415 [Martensiomyces pterosporus]